MSSRIEQIIDEIEVYINNCKPQLLSSTNIIVNKEEIEELLTELRLKTPDEIKRYQKIVSNKEAILSDAQSKGDAILAEAQRRAESMLTEATEHTTELINEHEIMQQAYAQANEVVQMATDQAQRIVDQATVDANDIRIGAVSYTDDMLKNLMGIIEHIMHQTSSKYEIFFQSLKENLDRINTNRNELAPEASDLHVSEAAAGEELDMDMLEKEADTEFSGEDENDDIPDDVDDL